MHQNPNIDERSDPDPSDDRATSARAALGGRIELSPEFRERLRERDPDALARFYELFFDRVYGYVKRMVGEEHLAEDVTQDIFMHIQRSLTTYDPTRELSPWVFTIATNKVRDFWRSRQHKDGLREESLDQDDAGTFTAAPQSNPLPALQNEELGRLLTQAIEELPASMRATLHLRYFEGLSFEAIAKMVDRNETAVRKRYSRALEELRRLLEKPLGIREGGTP